MNTGIRETISIQLSPNGRITTLELPPSLEHLRPAINTTELLDKLLTNKTKLIIEYTETPPTTIQWHLQSLTANDNSTYILTGIDITELASLKKQNHTLKHIIQKVPGYVFWKDKDLTLMGCNENFAQQIGLQHPDDVIGKTDHDLPWSSQETQAFHRDDSAVMQSGQPKLNIEETQRQANGHTAHLLTSKVPITNLQGDVDGILGIYIDITQLKETENALREAKEKAEAANHAKTEFLANMSHDLKTPLAGIIGLADILKQRLKEPLNVEFVEDIQNSGQKLLRFFENLFELMKHEERDLNLIEESFDLESTVTSIVDVYRPALRTKDLSLTIHFDEHLPMHLQGSRTGLSCILQNLIDNAIKFTDEGGIDLNFSAEFSSDQSINLIATVTDTGIGIAAGEEHIIFERGKRLTSAYDGNYEGSGIGLYLVGKLAATMQGSISVSSIVKQGSCFKIELPFKIVHKTSQQKSTEKLTTALCTTQVKLLIIEDNLTARKVLQHIIETLGYACDVASCGAEALMLLKKNSYHLIYLDIGLPDMDGYQLTKAFRKLEKRHHKYTPIIAVTAHAGVDIQHFCVGADINGLISKPITMKQVKQSIKKFVYGEDVSVDNLIVLQNLHKTLASA